MRSILAGLRTLTLPWGAAAGVPHIVIGVNPIPAELVAYYTTAPIGTNPETVVGLTINYDGAGNYAYQALVIDNATPHITSLVTGASVAGTVNEASRFALNPGVVLGNARFQTFLEENVLLLTSATGSNTVLGAQAAGDAFHRLSISRDGVVAFGTGAALTDAFIDRVGVGELRAAERLDIINFTALTSTALAVGLNTEANQRWFVRASGEVRASDGTLASDTTLYRAGVGLWAASRIAADNAGVAETAHAFPYAGGWADFAGGTRALTYEKLIDGRVHLVGVAKSPNPFTNLIGTLPVGYRPTAEIGGVGLANTGGGGLVQVLANGNVNVFLATINNEWWIDILIPTN